jgi:hypothetical protein
MPQRWQKRACRMRRGTAHPRRFGKVPPLPGEEALYKWIGSVLDAAAEDPAVKQALVEAALAADNELMAPLSQWQFNGNGWNSPVNNALWGTD